MISTEQGSASHWTGIPAGVPACPNAPPISLLVLPKEKRAVHGPKRKNALVATLHMRAKLLYGGRREIVPAGLRGLSDGRGGVRYRLDSGFPRRGCGGWPGCKDASDQLLFPRVPLRYALPGQSWRSLRWPMLKLSSTARPAAAKSGAECIPDLPGPKGSPRAARFRP